MDPNYNRAKLTTANFSFILMLPPSDTTWSLGNLPEKREGESQQMTNNEKTSKVDDDITRDII